MVGGDRRQPGHAGDLPQRRIEGLEQHGRVFLRREQQAIQPLPAQAKLDFRQVAVEVHPRLGEGVAGEGAALRRVHVAGKIRQVDGDQQQADHGPYPAREGNHRVSSGQSGA